MSSVLAFVLSVLLATIAFAIHHTTRPWNFPRNVPAIPLWVQVRSRILKTSRIAFYNKNVRSLAEKHGAVALWQEDRWGVIVSRPEYLLQVLKSADNGLEKCGTYARNPHSNGGFLFGENIIDSNDQLHAEFAEIMKPAIVKRFSIASMQLESARLADKLYAAQHSAGAEIGISIDEILWKWSITVFGDYFLGTKGWPLSFRETSAQHITALQNPNWVARLRGMFIITNLIPWRPLCYRKATTLIQQLEDTLVDVAESSKATLSVGGEPKLAQLLAHAHDEGRLSEFHYRSNLKQILVAGHENVEVIIQSAMFELAVCPRLQEQLYNEVTSVLPLDYTIQEIDRLPQLASIIYETLRLYPPLATLANRKTVKPMQLGSDILLPEGTIVGWSSYAVHTDGQVWGETARQFDPCRWGSDIEDIKRMVRSTQARGQFVPFSLYARRCLGSNFALTQLKVGLCEVVRRVKWAKATQKTFEFSQSFVTGPFNCKFNISER